MRKLPRMWMCMLMLLPFMAISHVQAAAPDTIWTRTYGGSSNDEAFKVIETSDGFYVLAGYTESFGAGESDVYLLKLDSNGDDIWIKTYGGEGNDAAYSVMETSDGYYVVAGYTESFGNGGSDVYVLKLDENGDTLWTRTYGSSSDDGAFSVIETSDGNYLVAGYTKSAGGGNVYLLMLDPDGDTLWTRNFGSSDNEEAREVIQASNGDFVIIGRSFSLFNGFWNVYYARTDAEGDTLWTRLFGGNGYDGGYGIVETEDQGYVVLGYTSSSGNGGSDLYIIGTDAGGILQWFRTQGGPEDEIGYSIAHALGEGYIIGAVTKSFGSGGEDAYFVKIDNYGNIIWFETYGGSQDDGLYCAITISDPGYLATGYTASMGAGEKDVYVLKFTQDAISESPGSSREKISLRAGSSLFSRKIDLYFSEVPGKPVEAVLYDASGRCLVEKQFDGSTKHVEIEGLGDLPSGVYFLEVAVSGMPGLSLRLVKVAR